MHVIAEKYWEYNFWTKERSMSNSRELMETIQKHRLGLSRLAPTTVVVEVCAALS